MSKLIPEHGDFLARLRMANEARAVESFGHAPDLSDWSPTDWGCALAGEVGELCNLLKKLRRNVREEDREVTQGQVEDEIADVLIYLDLLARRMGCDLAEVSARKFNVTSEAVGSPIRL